MRFTWFQMEFKCISLSIWCTIWVSQTQMAIAHTNMTCYHCKNYVALVKLCMPIPCTGVEYYPLRGYHGFRWNINASAFQYRPVYGYLTLRWLLPTSILPVTICNTYMVVVKFYMPIPCNGVGYVPLQGYHCFRWNYKAATF